VITMIGMGIQGRCHLGCGFPISHLADHVAVGCQPLRDDSADLLHHAFS